MDIIWCTYCYGHHLVHLRQVHPLKEKRCINIVDTPFVILWVVMDSNHRRHSQQIYSLPHLATLVTTR